MMDRVAEQAAEFFGSGAFIIFHVFFFAAWIDAHFLLRWDTSWQVLTLVVSLEAIFLSLFILRAEIVQSRRTDKAVEADLKKSDQVLAKLD